MKLTIITPTVLRPSLKRLCDSIDAGNHEDWQHIVIVDDRQLYMPVDLQDGRRLWGCSCDNWRAHGNPCRALAYKWATGDYITYIDDDNYYTEGALGILVEAIEKAGCPDWGVFPMLRDGGRFLNPCVGDCCTDNNQIFHKPVIKGIEIRYIPYDIPSADGKMAQGLQRLSDPRVFGELPELVAMEEALHGWRPGEDRNLIWGE